MKRHSPKVLFAASAVMLALALGGSVAMIALTGIDHSQDAPVASAKSEPEAVTKGGSNTAATVTIQPRRLPVAGLDGYYITVNPDGSSYMEEPGGKRTPLADAGSIPLTEDVIAKRATERIAKLPQKRTGIGQLIVLDKGVIDVPKDAIITFTGPDRLVTHDADGASTVYHVSGKVERRERSGRVNSGDAAKTPSTED